MLTKEELDRVCVVLVRARNPGNIGAVARAMHDFGFSRLRVVNEFSVPFEAAKSAVDASAVMENAVSFATVAEAVGDCTLVVGTTAVGERDLQHELVVLAEGAERMRAELRRNPMVDDEAVEHGAPEVPTQISEFRHGAPRARVAVVFGSEKTGLSNQEMSHCNWLLTVPMWEHAGVRHPSMNLGQAVAVCLYEMVRVSASPTSDGREMAQAIVADAIEPVNAAGLERITGLLYEVMERTEYTRRHAASSGLEDVRRLVRRMGASEAEAAVWLGFLRQVLWKLGSGAAKREADPSASLRDDKQSMG